MNSNECNSNLKTTLPPIRGSQPEVIRSRCHHHHTTTRSTTRFFAGRLTARHAHTPPTARRRRVAGALAARDLGAAAPPLTTANPRPSHHPSPELHQPHTLVSR